MFNPTNKYVDIGKVFQNIGFRKLILRVCNTPRPQWNHFQTAK